jgi:UDP-glucose 4-epimerase
MKEENLKIYGDGTQTRSFCYVDDMIGGLISMMESTEFGPINLGNPNCEFTLNDLVAVFEKVVSKKLNVDYSDATQNDPPYNENSYPAYDQSSYYVGTTTPLDAMNIVTENSKVSPNAMDPNWGGAAYTQSLVDQGYYKEDEVSIYIP